MAAATLATIGAIGVFLLVIGPTAAIREATDLPARGLGLLLIVGLTPVVVWGVSLYVAGRGAGGHPTLPRAVAGFTVLSFTNAVTPFGQAGGDPPAAAVIGRGFDADFETGLAAVGAASVANRLAAVVLGVAATVVAVADGTLPAPSNRSVPIAAAAGVVGIVGAVLAWRHRHTLVRTVTRVLAGLLAPLARLPRVEPPGARRLGERGDRFLDAVGRLATDPARLAALLAFGALGHLLVAAALWVAVGVVTQPAPLPVVVAATLAAKAGGVTPTPGGTGGVEAILTGVLVAGGVAAAPAGVAVLLYRAVAFWLPAAVGTLAVGPLTAVPDPRHTDETDRATPTTTDSTERPADESADDTGPSEDTV